MRSECPEGRRARRVGWRGLGLPGDMKKGGGLYDPGPTGVASEGVSPVRTRFRVDGALRTGVDFSL